MFKRKIIILLALLIALVTIFPVCADDNVTFDALAIDDAGQSFESSDQLSAADAAEDNLTESNLEDSLGDANITYKRVGTELHSVKFTQKAVDAKAGEKGDNFSVYLTSQNGAPLPNKTVKIGFNGVSYDIVTNDMGCANLQINLAKDGVYTFAVVYLGDNFFDASFNVYPVEITKKPTSITANAKTFKSKAKSKKYTVTLKTVKSKNGKTYLSAGKKITLKLKGKTYTAKTDAKGKATFYLKITKKGKFKATVKYAGDAVYKAYTKKANITIK